MEQTQYDFSPVKSGDTMLYSGTTWIAKDIMKFEKLAYRTGYNVSHAGKFRWDGNALFVVEAVATGVTPTPFMDYVTKEKGTIFVAKCFPAYTSEEVQKMIDFVMPICGKARYSYENLLVYELIRMTSKALFADRWFAKHWPKLYDKQIWIGGKQVGINEFICGQLSERVDNVVKGWFADGEPDAFKWAAPADIWNSEHYVEKLVWDRKKNQFKKLNAPDC